MAAALLGTINAIPAVGQTVETATVITPLKTEPDHNNVNITDGLARVAVPALSAPAAPRLKFDKLQNAVPYLTANISGGSGSYVESSIAVHTGASASESFSCVNDDVCRNVKMDGAMIDGDVVNGTYYTFTESQTGAVYAFDSLEYDSGTTQQTHKVIFYASSISYPDGEVISFTYDTARYSSGTGPIRHRLTRMSSNIGFYLSFSYLGNDPDQPSWGGLTQATLYNASAPSTPLGQLTYASNGTITQTGTDAAGQAYSRTDTCSGCTNDIAVDVEWSSASVTLPNESSVEEAVAPIGVPNMNKSVVSSVARDSVTWSYAYGNLRGDTHYDFVAYDNVVVSGPVGYHVTYNITAATEKTPNLISSIVDSNNHTTSYSYDTNFRPTLVTYPEGNSVQIGYDGYGNVTSKVSQPKPGSGLSAIAESAAIYQPWCDQVRVLCFRPIYYIDGLSRETDYDYDSAGRLIQESDPADSTGVRRAKYLSYTFGSSFTAPTLVRICGFGTTCGTSAEIQTQYAYWGQTALPLTETRIDGVTGTSLTTAYTYDNAGRLLVEDGPLAGTGDARYFRYDGFGRKTWEIGPANADGTRPAMRTTYRDADDKVIAVETGTIPDPSSASLTVATRADTNYDGRRNPIQVATSAGGTTYAVSNASFDDRGQQICAAVRMNPAAFGSLPDACSPGTQGSNGPDRITHNIYDAAGQLLQIQKAYGTALQQNEATYAWSPNGKQISVTDANGNLATMAYDGLDRLAQWTFPSKTTPGQVNPADYESYGYDAAGNRTSLRKRDGVTLAYQYDGLNRMIVKTVPASASGAAGYSVWYGYDVRGLQTYARFGSGSGPGITNAYDGFGRPTSSATTMSGVARTLAYQYDAAGNRTQVLHPDGIRFDISYDAGNRMTGASWTTGAGTTQFLWIGYDDLGRRYETGRPSSQTDYGYDGIGRLSSDSQHFLGSAGNLNTSFAYNPASQIVTQTRDNDDYHASYVSDDRSYGVNGLNQYSSVKSSTYGYDANGNLTSDGIDSYVYDAENRLVSATRSGGTTLAYDPLGRLWQTSSPHYGTTRFVYDGDHVAAEYDGVGTMRRRYFWGPGPSAGSGQAADEPILQDEGGTFACGATTFFLHADHQGSIVATADCAGTRQYVNRYDEYGVPAATNQGRFQYTGQAWIDDLGMYYYKARLYSPMLGRFMQTDPIGYKGGLNFYEYVGDDPINEEDPTGECGAGASATGATGQGTTVIIYCSDGTNEIRHGGSLAWRNNNPGNLRDYPFSVRHGMIGTAHAKSGRFAIFPSFDVGKSALKSLLAGPTYSNLTPAAAINKYAPANENDPASYARFVRSQTGDTGTSTLGQLSDKQMGGVVSAIMQREGFSAGNVTYTTNANGTATVKGSIEVTGSLIPRKFTCQVGERVSCN